ncbi:hypothetical protein CAL12_20340 [Bordetella genomosp. 8]|uniref:Uncharacterized protein n=1 Tax=Bordetella genomosp. 8 TaxID=1416806 RepID=A0A1W6YPB9_9BORD|nr:hypothetical protein [Bordetella genomosp. 8]ARP82932.1 hypothetical protein CAL12_20340 [Bordetella genomosp. 8]
MSRAKIAKEAGLRAFLTGYGRQNRDGLAAIANYGAWALLAARESERRIVRVLESLPLEEVQAIAGLEIDLNALAGQVLDELDGK